MRGDEDGALWILGLGSLVSVAPAEGEITHGRQLQQERVVKVRNSHPVVKPQEKSHQMRISHMVQMWDLRPVVKSQDKCEIHTWLQLAKW